MKPASLAGWTIKDDFETRAIYAALGNAKDDKTIQMLLRELDKRRGE